MKFPAELTYAALRYRGATRRYLFCRTEETPRFGDPSFDFMGYFGFGAGEFEGEHPPRLDAFRVRTEALSPGPIEGFNKVLLANWMTEPTDEFRGFYTTDGLTYHKMILDPEGVLVPHLKALNWHYYTNIGSDRGTAVDHIMTLNRRHFLFETYDEQSRILLSYAEMAAAI